MALAVISSELLTGASRSLRTRRPLVCSCFHWLTVRWLQSQLDFFCFRIWSIPLFTKDHRRICDSSCSEFKLLAMEKSTKAVSCFCFFSSTVRWWGFEKGGLWWRHEEINGRVASTRGEGREKRAVVGLVQMSPPYWDSGGGKVKGQRGGRDREREHVRLKLYPLHRSARSCRHFGREVSVSPTDTWRWRSPQSLCPSRWSVGGRALLPRRSRGGLHAASGQRPRSASLLQIKIHRWQTQHRIITGLSPRQCSFISIWIPTQATCPNMGWPGIISFPGLIGRVCLCGHHR